MERTGSPAVHEISATITARIPTRAGIELGATLTRPVTQERVPALVTYHPYRGAWDGGVGADARYYAARGYAFVHLHSPGSGNSDGLSLDEYSAEETAGGYDAIEWLAAQPWCSGSVGMLGASYSGFTTLQVAALAPPALKAIAPAYFTDRRYTDDCHYKGGCLRGYYDTLHYGLWMVGMNALPPHPQAVGDRWAAIWRKRLEEGEPYLLKWLLHPVEDEYWAHGSVIGQYDRIQAASLLIGGWHDGYPNPPLRTFRSLRSPKKLLMGPWSHTYPDRSHCGPRIDIYFELLRWWDRWLKGIDNGVEQEPRVWIYLQEFEPPVQDRTEIAGAWHVSDDLPEEEDDRWRFGEGRLEREDDRPPTTDERGNEGTREGSLPRFGAGGGGGALWRERQRAPTTLRAVPPGAVPRGGGGGNVHSFAYLPAASPSGGIWDGGMAYCLPGDQRRDEALAVNYTSAPLDEELVILGQPSVTLTVSTDVPVLPLACRLCEVGEDGTSVLVTKGILNLTRRNGMDTAEPLEPGVPTPVKVELEATAWRFQKGHRIRLSINGSDFPNVWPTPYRGTGTIHAGPAFEAALNLPLWRDPGSPPFPLPPSESAAAATGSGGTPAPWRVTHDVLEDRLHFLMASGSEFVVSNRDPAVAYTRGKSTSTASWEGFTARAEATAALNSDATSFHLTLTLNVTVNDAPFFQRRWCQSTARRLM